MSSFDGPHRTLAEQIDFDRTSFAEKAFRGDARRFFGLAIRQKVELAENISWANPDPGNR